MARKSEETEVMTVSGHKAKGSAMTECSSMKALTYHFGFEIWIRSSLEGHFHLSRCERISFAELTTRARQ